MAIKMFAFFFFNCLIGVFGQGPPPPPDSMEFTMNFVSPVYACSDEASLAFIDPSDLQTTRVNESFASMTGSIIFHTAFDYSTKVEIAVQKEANGNYETVFTHEICSVCEEISNPDSDYKGYLMYCGFPDECPFDAGPYKVNDLVTDTTDIPCNSANAGSYLVEISFYKDDGNCKDGKEFLGCIKLELVIEPL